MAAILKVGFPLALQDALVNISFLIITAVINAMGLVASAAVGWWKSCWFSLSCR